jgi:P-type Ca2+ transporter type 2C
MDALRRLLGTTDPSMKEFRWALIPAIALRFLGELGKFVARQRTGAKERNGNPDSLAIR